MPISHQLVPPGGWKFFEKRTSITIMAHNWDALRNHLERHRKANGIPVGDVEKDIEDQISADHPDLVI